MCASSSTPGTAVVEAGQIGEAFAARRRGRYSLPRSAISSSVSRQSAEKPGSDDRDRASCRRRPSAASVVIGRGGAATSPGRTATGRRRSARGPAHRTAAAPFFGSGNDRGSPSSSVRWGMPWKLATIVSGSKSSSPPAMPRSMSSAPRCRPGRHNKAAACAAPAASASPPATAKAASLAVAVVAAQYCGYSGAIRIRSHPACLQRGDPPRDRRDCRTASRDRPARRRPERSLQSRVACALRDRGER